MKVNNKFGQHYFQSPDAKQTGGFGVSGRHAMEPLVGKKMLTR